MKICVLGKSRHELRQHWLSKGKQTIIGELDGSRSERVLAIAAEFNRAGLATTVITNIVGTMWDKLLVNVSTSALSGITGLTYGQLYAVPEQAWNRAVEGLPPEFKASMLQSLSRTRRHLGERRSRPRQDPHAQPAVPILRIRHLYS